MYPIPGFMISKFTLNVEGLRKVDVKRKIVSSRFMFYICEISELIELIEINSPSKWTSTCNKDDSLFQ